MPRPAILIIEDERLIRWSLRQRLTADGADVIEAETGQAGLALLGEQFVDLVLLDYRLPDITGLEVLQQVRSISEDVVVVMMTAYSSVESAVQAMKLGAADYLCKPFDMDEMALLVEKHLKTTELQRRVRHMQQQLQQEYGFDRIVGTSEPMQAMMRTIQDIATGGSSTVFLQGPSGTGKDLVAKTIHYNSDRADKPFMNITCTALAETLLESELFGHEAGAFTDARARKKGLLELADGGTVFLDEVADMPARLQAKLLRFLEEKVFRRVGGTDDISVDVRIIAATNRDVLQAVRDGQFRNDLYYRLNIIPLHLPALADREGDVELLAQYFLAHYARQFKRQVDSIDEQTLHILRQYDWPGNVRELRNVVERAVLLSKGSQLTVDDFATIATSFSDTSVPGASGSGARQNAQPGADVLTLPADGVDLAILEKDLVRQALERVGGNRTHAAQLLGLSRDQLRYRIEKYGLE